MTSKVLGELAQPHSGFIPIMFSAHVMGHWTIVSRVSQKDLTGPMQAPNGSRKM